MSHNCEVNGDLLYVLSKHEIKTENYIKFNLTPGQRSIIAQIRLGILPIAIETGRFNNIPADERYCFVCNCQEIEVELHFIFHCNHYENERHTFLQTVQHKNPEFIYLDVNQQLTYLFSDCHRALAKYLSKCYMKRKNILSR